MTCSKLYEIKIKYSKNLQSQRTKDEKKTSFNFALIIYIRVQQWNLIVHPPPLYYLAQESSKNLQFIGICYSLSFLLWFKALH